MKFLLSNDDGYNKIGILALKESLLKYGDVYISAPLKEHSGASSSITFKRNRDFAIIDDKTIAVDGTPVDSVLFGFEYFKTKFDYVFTGINNGFNLSFDTLYSGTIGAAITGSLMGSKVIALSCDRREEYLDIKNKTEKFLEYYFNNTNIQKFKFLSINYPNIFYKEGLGFKVGRIYNYEEYSFNFFDELNSLKVYESSKKPLDYDRYLTAKGYYTITPIRQTLEDTELINELKLSI